MAIAAVPFHDENGVAVVTFPVITSGMDQFGNFCARSSSNGCTNLRGKPSMEE